MWKTEKDFNLTQLEIDEIVEKLWKEENNRDEECPDCGVKQNETHIVGCDIAHCINCGDQTLFGDCCDNLQNDTWTGLWPGVETAYKNKTN